MAVIVRHRASHAEFVLLGPGYGAYMSRSYIGFFKYEESGEHFKVAVCDRRGAIQWLDAQDVTVVAVDGVAPSEVLDDRKQRPAVPPP